MRYECGSLLNWYHGRTVVSPVKTKKAREGPTHVLSLEYMHAVEKKHITFKHANKQPGQLRLQIKKNKKK